MTYHSINCKCQLMYRSSKVSFSSIHPNSLSFIYHAPACMNHQSLILLESRSLLQDYHDCEKKGHELVKYQETSWVDLRVCLKGSNMNRCFGFLGGWEGVNVWFRPPVRVSPILRILFLLQWVVFFGFCSHDCTLLIGWIQVNQRFHPPLCCGAAIGFLAGLLWMHPWKQDLPMQQCNNTLVEEVCWKLGGRAWNLNA